jgi:hypothetical protein
MIINKIESNLVKSVTVMLGMFVLQLVLYHSYYLHTQAQYIFLGSLFVQVIASLSALFFLAWFLVDIIKSGSKRVSVNDRNFNNQAAKKKAA